MLLSGKGNDSTRVTIGDHAIVGAQTVISKDVPPKEIVAGNPSKKIGLRKIRAMIPFTDKKVLITGGMGFIGSNLARRLVGYENRVTVVDSMSPQYGGNSKPRRFNG